MEKSAYLSLAGLSDRISAGLRSMAMMDESGHVSEMVYVPRFAVYANSLFGGTWPSQTMYFGGFMVDKFQASHHAAGPFAMGCAASLAVGEDDGNVAVSRFGVLPWTQVSHSSAQNAAANRVIGGRRCRLMGLQEWAAIAILCEVAGWTQYGNTKLGYDSRDRVFGVGGRWADKGAVGSDGVWACGTGPFKTATLHNPLGIYDLVGNVGEMVHSVLRATVVLELQSELETGIDDDDTSITLCNVVGLSQWGANGFAMLDRGGFEELVHYAGITDLGGGRCTLTGVTRGYDIFTPAAHLAGVRVVRPVSHHLVPGGFVTCLAGPMDDSTDPVTVTVKTLSDTNGADCPYLAWPKQGPGRTTELVEGDVVQIQNELLEVTGVAGADVTFARAQLGTVKASHISGSPLLATSPSANLDFISMNGHTNWVQTAAIMSVLGAGLGGIAGLPATAAQDLTAAARLDLMRIQHHMSVDGVLVRGGGAAGGDYPAISMWHMEAQEDAAGGDDAQFRGFRCVLDLPGYTLDNVLEGY